MSIKMVEIVRGWRAVSGADHLLRLRVGDVLRGELASHGGGGGGPALPGLRAECPTVRPALPDAGPDVGSRAAGASPPARPARAARPARLVPAGVLAIPPGSA